MQVARQPAPLVLVRGDEAPPKASRLALGAAPSDTLPEKRGNEDGLQHDHGDRCDDRAAMLLPHRGWLEADFAPGRQARRVDVPAPKLAPIVDGRLEPCHPDPWLGGSSSAQDAMRRLRDVLAAPPLRRVRSADDALTELVLIKTEDRSVGGRVESR